jgi:hypothetical protein
MAMSLLTGKDTRELTGERRVWMDFFDSFCCHVCAYL